MDRLERSERAPGAAPEMLVTCTLDEWLLTGMPRQAEVHLDPTADLAAHYEALSQVARIVIEFPAFTDGRGFSHARKLRAAGFAGPLLAAGDVLADQWQFLERCGFTAIADEDDAVSGGRPFSDAYQGDERQPIPLFRRREAR